jgi:putative membrane protein
MRKAWIGALLTTCLVAPSFVVHAGDSDISSQDRKFIRSASEDGLTVERMGQMAAQVSQNPGVKQLTQKLSRDYAQADQKLRAMGQKLDVAAPSELSSRSTREVGKLDGFSGGEFDQAALRELVKAEQIYLREMEDEASQGNNAELKQFATTTLPPLQDDIYQVVRLQSDLNVTASTSTGNSANTGQPLAEH